MSLLMPKMPLRPPIRGMIAVITGASAGLGRETAVQLAREGCRVALAARREADLEATATLCRAAGGAALVVVTDVTSERDVERLAEATLAAWGRIDVWINNAGTTLFGGLTDAPLEEHRRVIETNVFGAMAGARAAIPLFRAQGRGVLINVGSIVSKVGQPFVPSYAISKFALRGMSESLAIELADEPDVHVCTIYPYAIDTPHFQSGANYVGRRARAMPPLQSPERVAAAIVALVRRPRRETHVPRIAVVGLALRRLFPELTDRLILRALEAFHFDDAHQPSTSGNLHHPIEIDEACVHGARPPRVGVARFAAWSLRELASIGLEATVRGRRRVSTASAELGDG